MPEITSAHEKQFIPTKSSMMNFSPRKVIDFINGVASLLTHVFPDSTLCCIYYECVNKIVCFNIVIYALNF